MPSTFHEKEQPMGNSLMVRFKSEEKGLIVTFPSDVVTDLQKYRQSAGMKEAGGMLFTNDLENNEVIVNYVSLPTYLDKRGRWFFKPNPKSSQSIIQKQFKKGSHYIGDWHSHSEKYPSPSPKDKRTFRQVFVKSDHELRFMIMLILSANNLFSDSFVALVKDDNIYNCAHLN